MEKGRLIRRGLLVLSVVDFLGIACKFGHDKRGPNVGSTRGSPRIEDYDI